MSELDAYSEAIANRSAAYRGQSVGGNVTGALGAQPGNSNTVGGGQNVIATSTDLDNASQFTSEFSVNNIPDDPKAYVSSNKSEVLERTSYVGNGAIFVSESKTQTAGTTAGLKTIALANSNVIAVSSVFAGGLTYPLSGTVANASGAGYALSGSSIVWNNGTYVSYVVPMASGWVPSGSATFTVDYTFTGSVNQQNNIPVSTPLGIQQSFLGNAGQTTQAGSSFGGWDITR